MMKGKKNQEFKPEPVDSDEEIIIEETKKKGKKNLEQSKELENSDVSDEENIKDKESIKEMKKETKKKGKKNRKQSKNSDEEDIIEEMKKNEEDIIEEVNKKEKKNKDDFNASDEKLINSNKSKQIDNTQQSKLLEMNMNKVYKVSDVDFINVEVTNMKKTEMQLISYIEYLDPDTNTKNKLIVQTPMMKLTRGGGIPKINPKFKINDDKDREFINVPLDENQPNALRFKEHLEKADEFFGSDKIKKKLFKEKAKEYMYQPIVRKPNIKEEDDVDSDNDNKKFTKKKKEDVEAYPDKCKLKFNIRYGDNDEHFNVTTIILTEKTTDGKKIEETKKTEMKPTTITEISELIKYRSDVRYMIYYYKLWAAKSKLQGATYKMYGVGLKIIALEYTPPSGSTVNSNSVAFISSDEEDDEVNKKMSSKTKKLENDLSSKDKKKSEISDDSSEEEEIKPKKKNSKK